MGFFLDSSFSNWETQNFWFNVYHVNVSGPEKIEKNSKENLHFMAFFLLFSFFFLVSSLWPPSNVTFKGIGEDRHKLCVSNTNLEERKMRLPAKNILFPFFFIAEKTRCRLSSRWVTLNSQKVGSTGMTGCASVSAEFPVSVIN